MTLLIMAAGMGSRYGGLKQIDPVTASGEFIVDFSIYDALQAGFDKVVFIIKEENYEAFRETVGKRIENKIKVEYVFQSLEMHVGGAVIPEGRIKPWGTGHAVLCAKDTVKDNFAVINADDFYGRDAYKKIAEYLSAEQPASDIARFCMAGYMLGNTLTENGHVARGICCINENGLLTDITERTKIIKTATEYGAAYEENNGATDNWIPVSTDTTVSMNCWGFTPAFFARLEAYFRVFLSELNSAGDPLKAEFYLPAAVDTMMSEGLCTVSVLKTSAKWYGVTYHDDKPYVMAQLRKQIDEGVYPSGLWK